ncbi:anthranilate phosphoribosyltransferase [Aliikangiella sp. IMCC44632]
MQNIHQKLFEKSALSQEESCQIFSQFVTGQQNPVMISAILTALKLKGESPQEVAGAAQALQQNASLFSKPDYPTADSCGTGGSGKHTLNISTLVAFIAAEKGLKMVKHGNRSISSQCGSADVLEALGVNISMPPQVARACLDKVGVTFLFAPLYHPGVKHVMPVRNQLKTRTIFNLLGPLINPAKPEFQLMGVYSAEYCYAAAESLRLSGCQSAMVVHSMGCDEITLAGNTYVAHLNEGKISEYQLSADDFGLPSVPLEALFGGSPTENAQTFVEVLKGTAKTPVLQTVAANAGALFYLSGHASTLKQGVNDALQIMQSGRAFDLLLAFAELSQTGELS